MATVLLGFIELPLSVLREPIGRLVREQTGLHLQLNGELSLRLGWRTQLYVTDVSLAPADDPVTPLIAAGSLRAQPRLLRLLRGDIDLRQAEVAGLIITDCMELQRLAGQGGGGTQMPGIGVDALELTDARMRCGVLPGGDPLRFRVRTASGTGSMNRPIELVATGSISTLDVTANASGPSLNDLLADAANLPLALEIKASGAQLAATGTISTLLSDFTIVADTTGSAANPPALLDAFNIKLPPLPAVSVAGLTKLTAADITVTGAAGRLGDSELTDIDLLVRWSGQRIYTDASARVDRLSYDLLVPAGDGEAAAEPAPDPLSVALPVLENFDGRLALRLGRFDNAPVDVRDIDATAMLKNGELDIELRRVLLAGAAVAGEASLRTDSPCASSEVRLSAGPIPLEPWNALLQTEAPLMGSVDRLAITASSCGNTLETQLHTLRIDARAEGLDPQFGELRLPANIQSAELKTGWDDATRLVVAGVANEDRFAARLDTGSLRTLFDALRWPVSLAIDGAGSRIRANGELWAGPGLPGGALRTTVDIPRIGSLANWAIVRRESALPLRGRVDIRVDDREIALNRIELQLGDSDLSGDITTERDPDGAVIRAMLRSDFLDLRQLGQAEAARPAEADSPEPPGVTATDEFDLALLGAWLELPVEFDVGVTQLRGLVLYNPTDVRLTGRIGDWRISDARLELSIEESRLIGQLNADFSQGEAILDYQSTVTNVDIGQLIADLELRDGVKATASKIDVDISTRGRTLLGLANNARLEATLHEFDWIIDLPGPKRELDPGLSKLQISVAPDQPTIWDWTAVIDGVPVRNWLRTPPLEQTLDPRQTVPLKLVSIAGKDIVAVQATIGPEEPGAFNADIEISGDLLETTTEDPERLALPLPDYRLAGSLAADQEALVISDIEFETGRSRIEGRIDSVFGETRNQTRIRLAAPLIETNDFLELTRDFRESQRRETPATAEPAAAEPQGPGMLVVVRDLIRALTEYDDFNIEVQVDQLYSNGVDLGTANATIRTDAEQFELRPLQIAMPGGDIDGGFRISQTPAGATAELDVSIEGLDYGGIAKLIDTESTAGGVIYAETNLRAAADTTAALPRNITGEFEMLVIPENIQAGILNLWAGNVILALLANTSQDERKKLNCLVARFDADDGVLTSRDTFLDSTDVIVRGRGNIDAGNQTIDMLFAPQAKRERFFSVKAPFEVKGSWQDASVGAAPGSFVATIFRWSLSLIYVPYKWLTGARFPEDGRVTCFNATRWDMPASMQAP